MTLSGFWPAARASATPPTCNTIVTGAPLLYRSAFASITGIMKPSRKAEAAQSRSRAVLRLVLGQAQVIGATTALVLLFRGGVSAPDQHRALSPRLERTERIEARPLGSARRLPLATQNVTIAVLRCRAAVLQPQVSKT